MENSFSSDSDVDPIGSEENAATGSYTEPVVDVTEHESAVTKSNLAVHETDIKDNGGFFSWMGDMSPKSPPILRACKVLIYNNVLLKRILL